MTGIGALESTPIEIVKHGVIERSLLIVALKTEHPTVLRIDVQGF